MSGTTKSRRRGAPKAATAPPPRPEQKAPAVEMIPPAIIDPHPQNPRGELTRESVAELRAAIEAQGQLQPCLVRRKGESLYEMLVGHRRLYVARLLDRLVPCVVEDLDDDQALLVMWADNAQHELVDPFREADLVHQLLERPNRHWTMRLIADALGKSLGWVSRRAQLARLPQVLLEARRDPQHPLSEWPIAWLEQLGLIEEARLSVLLAEAVEEYREETERQQKWGGDRHDFLGAATRQQLRRLVAEETHLLGLAPWDLEDVALVPEVGTCTACLRTSLRAPGLFDGLDKEEPRTGSELERAHCRDGGCWAAKLKAWAKLRLAELKRENKDAVVVRSHSGPLGHNDVTGKSVLSSWEAEEVDGPGKGVKRAVFVDDRGPRLGWAKVGRGDVIPPRGPKKPDADADEDPAEKLERSRKQIENRRQAWVIDHVRQSVLDVAAPQPLPGTMRLLTLCYPVGEPEGAYSHNRAQLAKERGALADDALAWLADLWKRMRGAVAQSVDRPSGLQQLDAIGRTAQWLAGLLDIDWASLQARAVAQIPDPKWWAKAGE